LYFTFTFHVTIVFFVCLFVFAVLGFELMSCTLSHLPLHQSCLVMGFFLDRAW
jgi:hypothetical protein